MRFFIVSTPCSRFSSFLPSVINHLFNLFILFSAKLLDLILLFRMVQFLNYLWITVCTKN